jgi:hypothetical protein
VHKIFKKKTLRNAVGKIIKKTTFLITFSSTANAINAAKERYRFLSAIDVVDCALSTYQFIVGLSTRIGKALQV